MERRPVHEPVQPVAAPVAAALARLELREREPVLTSRVQLPLSSKQAASWPREGQPSRSAARCVYCRRMNATSATIEHEIDSALNRLREVVLAAADVQEADYLGHEARYRRSLRSISELAPKGARVLDVGSHYLHQST